VLACRLIVGAVLAWCVARAALAPEIGIAASLAAIAILAVTLWRPAIGLTLAVASIPAGALLAAPPARGAELLAWAFLAGWLLRLWRPLADGGWPRAPIQPALLYGACAAASWLALGIAGAAGVDAAALPMFLARTIPADYLVFAVPETETWSALQLLTGVALFAAAAGIARSERALPSWLAWALVASATVLAAATIADVWRQWAAAEYGTWFLARYVNGERFSLHVADVNAAGSQYVLATGIAAALAYAEPRRRWLAIVAVLVMLPALWLTGSRTAFFGAAGALVAIALAVNARRLTLARRRLAAAALVLAALAVTASLLAARGGEQGSAGHAMRMRAQFAETSARMFATAPVFGVGVGKYFERSSAFMPEELRTIYGAENAHNYFAQTFAELGIVGGVLFLWLLAATLAAAWHALAADEHGGLPNGALTGLFAGSAGYLVTCIAGHPLLVAEVALPFWAALGVLASAGRVPRQADGVGPAEAGHYRRGVGPVDAGHDRRDRLVMAATGLVLAAGIVLAIRTYRSTSEMPLERGFDSFAVASDGTEFRWMTPHVTSYVPGGPGFLRLVARAPDTPLARPMVLETSIGGRLLDRREISADAWSTIEIPVRDDSGAPFRRIDVHATPTWSARRPLAQRSSEVTVTLTAMVSELKWEPAR
jgi:O-antigen ligase